MTQCITILTNSHLKNVSEVFVMPKRYTRHFFSALFHPIIEQPITSMAIIKYYLEWALCPEHDISHCLLCSYLLTHNSTLSSLSLLLSLIHLSMVERAQKPQNVSNRQNWFIILLETISSRPGPRLILDVQQAHFPIKMAVYGAGVGCAHLPIWINWSHEPASVILKMLRMLVIIIHDVPCIKPLGEVHLWS